MINKNILLLIFFLSFLSCKKNENSTVNITSKVWKPSLTDANTASNPSANVQYHPFLNCEQDDTYQFGTNGKLTINHGAIKCEGEEAIKIVDYSYNRETKELIIDNIKFKVAEESKIQLKYYLVLPEISGYSYIVFMFN
ncbi:hypothetical protein [Pedobacter glucosidilyticus]|uniref:hypothetical protein n=1 Tax=Pedobacter glucosidilyticus TaxID=1122941 RepID=UPI0026EA4457|nr:hypothetical protein [Pedobacter glucosidilyticus]